MRNNRRKERLPILTGLAILAVGLVIAAGIWVLPEKEPEKAKKSNDTRTAETTKAEDPSLRLSYMKADEAKAQEILGILQDPLSDNAARFEAIQDMEMIDTDLWEPILLAAIQDPNKEVRIHVAVLLAKMPDEFAAPLLRVLLHDPDADVREYATDIIPGMEAVYVMQVYDPQNQEIEFEPDVIEEAVYTLAEFDDKIAFEIILDMLSIVEGHIDFQSVYTDPTSNVTVIDGQPAIYDPDRNVMVAKYEDGSERIIPIAEIGMYVEKDKDNNVYLVEQSEHPEVDSYKYTRDQIIEALFAYTDETFNSFDDARVWWRGNIDPVVNFEVYNEYASKVGSVSYETSPNEITSDLLGRFPDAEELIIADVAGLELIASAYTGQAITFNTPKDAVTWFIGNEFLFDETMFNLQFEGTDIHSITNSE